MTKKQRRQPARRARSEGLAAVHEAARDLRSVGAIDKKTMREFDALCLDPPKALTARDVARIRSGTRVSQNLFARYLNTSPSTVQKWETGAKRPSAIASKLLRVVEKHGLDVLL